MSAPAGRNPMQRTSDRVQRRLARLLLVCVLVGVPAAAVTTGVSSYRAQLHAVQVQHVTRHAVTARLTEDVPGVAPPGRTAVPGTVAWTAADGSRHSVRIAVLPGTRAGTPVRLWLDAQGSVVPAPATPGRALTTAVTVATAAGTAGAALCLVVWKGSVRFLDHRRYAQWDAEWARIEPRWTQRSSG
ncbi:hypothetical protein [Kitasatospora sp. NPDC059571]|uniref:Rv1733c family protein n=1 Tax=Kitasatospora sp. NPDC059571 TaxID=3346871 RepID=UPI0036B91F83